jgi:carboxymethylenebutenolidase
MTDQDLNPQQQKMVEIWERHMAAEFKTKSIDATMATMTSDPYVNHVPVMTGGVGYDEVRHFYNTILFPASRRTQTLCRSAGRLEKTASSTN